MLPYFFLLYMRDQLLFLFYWCLFGVYVGLHALVKPFLQVVFLSFDVKHVSYLFFLQVIANDYAFVPRTGFFLIIFFTHLMQIIIFYPLKWRLLFFLLL